MSQKRQSTVATVIVNRCVFRVYLKRAYELCNTTELLRLFYTVGLLTVGLITWFYFSYIAMYSIALRMRITHACTL